MKPLGSRLFNDISLLFSRRRLLLCMLALTVTGGCLLPMIDGWHLYNGRFSRDLLYFLLNLQGLILCIVFAQPLSGTLRESPSAAPLPKAIAMPAAAAAVCSQMLLTGMSSIALLWLLTGARPHEACAGLLLLSSQFAILSSIYSAARSRFHPMTAMLLMLLAFVLGYHPDLPGLDTCGSWVKFLLTLPIPDLSSFCARGCLVFEWHTGSVHIISHILYSVTLCLFYFSLSLPRGKSDES